MHDPSHRPIIPKHSVDNLFLIIDQWVGFQPDALLFSFLDTRGRILEQLTYRQFAREVNSLAAYFQKTVNADHGSRILLSYQPGLEQICALFACNKAGFIGVPSMPPTVHNLQAWLNSIDHVLDDSQAAAIAMCGTTWSILDACQPASAEDTAVRNRLKALAPVVTTGAASPESTPDSCEPCDTFFLQYTSGSTTEPKGVMVSHGNLIANAEAVVDHGQPVAVSWLPQHHDMGLIGYYINIALGGGRTYGFAPNSFIKRPTLWFETITKYRATASSIPAFALELVLNDRRVPQASLAEFDLQSLRFLMVAAEPVSADRFLAFLQKFSPCGLKRESLFVAYGLAEFTLAVSNYGRRSISVDRNALALGAVEPAKSVDGRSAVRVMSCGRLLGDTRLEIVNPESLRPAGTNKTGEVWLAGQSRARGYWNNPPLSQAVFAARLASDEHPPADYLRTGDVGFMDDGELFICGRIKDMMIIHGQNIYPQDVESEIQAATSKVRRNSVAAYATEGSTTITVLAELVRVNDIPDGRELVGAIRERIQVSIGNLVFLAPRSIARTSSGKIRRAKTQALFEEGLLDVVSRYRPDFASCPQTESGEQIDEFEALKRRYRLTGEEDFTLLDAGIDSLDLIVLLHWLRDECRRRGSGSLADRITVRLFGILTVKQIFRAGRLLRETPELAVEALAGTIRTALNDRIEHERRQMKDDSDYCRTEDSSGRAQSAPSTDIEARDVLLTGGTGFLGPFLLLSLLQQTTSRISVLVRSGDPDGARNRLRREFAGAIGPSVPMDAFDSRVDVLNGDLTRPQFGLPNADWQKLLRNVGAIYHNAALVNYLLDYRHMRPANVAGTARVIDLAFTGCRKVLNYVSTTFIFGWATKDVLYETDRNSDMAHLDFGYSQSKWVAEQLVYTAMSQGLQARVFRPALITPALDGRGGEVDITLRLLAFMVRHGVCVVTGNQVSFMPVDMTANNIVAIARMPETLNETFHVTRERHETMPQVTDIISERTGISFNAFSLEDFVPEVIQRCTHDDLLFPLLDFLVESVDNITAMEYKLYDNTCYRNARDRSPSGQSDASLEDVVAGIIRYLERRNLLPNA